MIQIKLDRYIILKRMWVCFMFYNNLQLTDTFNDYLDRIDPHGMITRGYKE